MSTDAACGPRDLFSEGQFEYDSIRYAGFTSPEVLNRVKQFPFTADDICIVTYPKAGTSWLEEITYLLCHHGDVAQARARTLDERICFLEIHVPDHGPLVDIFHHGSPRLFRTHFNTSFFQHVLNTPSCPKFIFGTRNIKDSLVSGYHFSRMNIGMGGFKGSWHDWFETFKLGRMYYGDYYDFNLDWWRAHEQDKHRILHVSYEDLHRDHRGNVKRMADFLGKSFSDEQLDQIVSATTFGDMKEKGNLHDLPSFDESISPFMRKGKIGDWRNYFTAEQEQYMTELRERRLGGSDLTINFD